MTPLAVLCCPSVAVSRLPNDSRRTLESGIAVPIRVRAFRGFTPRLNMTSEVKCCSTHSVELLSLQFVLVEMTGEAELCQDGYRSLSAQTACHHPAPPIALAALERT